VGRVAVSDAPRSCTDGADACLLGISAVRPPSGRQCELARRNTAGRLELKTGQKGRLSGPERRKRMRAGRERQEGEALAKGARGTGRRRPARRRATSAAVHRESPARRVARYPSKRLPARPDTVDACKTRGCRGLVGWHIALTKVQLDRRGGPEGSRRTPSHRQNSPSDLGVGRSCALSFRRCCPGRATGHSTPSRAQFIGLCWRERTVRGAGRQRVARREEALSLPRLRRYLQ